MLYFDTSFLAPLVLPEAASERIAAFVLELDDSFTVLLPGADDFNLARQYLAKFETRLRAGDALHLAIASNHHAEIIYSLDKTLLKAGDILGLPMSMGIQPA